MIEFVFLYISFLFLVYLLVSDNLVHTKHNISNYYRQIWWLKSQSILSLPGVNGLSWKSDVERIE